MLTLDLDRLHNQPKTGRGSGKTFDAVMQVIGTIEVLLENNNDKPQFIPVFAGPEFIYVYHFSDKLFEVLYERIKGQYPGARINDQIQNITIGSYIKVRIYTSEDIYNGRFENDIRGHNCTQPIFDVDCGLISSEVERITNYIQSRIN